MSAEEIEDLESSELGTKEHWDKAYEEELENFKNHGIVGDVWFGDDIMMKIVRYIEESEDITPESTIVDLGCGNGSLLLELAREGYTNLTGMDYSDPALKMAEALLTSEGFPSIQFKTFDLLQDAPATPERFNVCLDKGTFDAISLCPDLPQSEARQRYFENVTKLLKEDGIFILTSCNWTAKELVSFAEKHFLFSGVIPTPQFNFGGKSGNLVSIVILRRKVNVTPS